VAKGAAQHGHQRSDGRVGRQISCQQIDWKVAGRLFLTGISHSHESGAARKIANGRHVSTRGRQKRAIEHDDRWPRGVDRHRRGKREHASKLDVVSPSPQRR
jgi:hypothetical protein